MCAIDRNGDHSFLIAVVVPDSPIATQRRNQALHPSHVITFSQVTCPRVLGRLAIDRKDACG